MGDEKIALNEMRGQVAKLIFGDDWIGSLTNAEHEILRQRGFSPRKILRLDGTSVVLEHAQRLRSRVASKFDRAVGKAIRLQCQYVTVDTWLQDHGMLRGVDRAGNIHGDRKAFRRLIRSETSKQAAAVSDRRQGPKPAILPRVKAAMENDLRDGKIRRDELAAMPDKELEGRYQARRGSVREARKRALENAIPPNAAKK
jgi:hypothetical protein